MSEVYIDDIWGQTMDVWVPELFPEAVFISVMGPRGGHRAALRLTPAQANALATALINAAERVRQAT